MDSVLNVQHLREVYGDFFIRLLESHVDSDREFTVTLYECEETGQPMFTFKGTFRNRAAKKPTFWGRFKQGGPLRASA